MANAQLYNAIAQKKNLPISELERILGVGSSTISKAIARNSVVKPPMIGKLSEAFPDLDLKQLEIELLNPTQPDVKKPDSVEEPGIAYNDPWKDKYIEAIERENQRLPELSREAAITAVRELASSYATKQEVQGISANLDKSRKVIAAHEVFLTALQEFVTYKFAQVQQIPFDDVATELSKVMIRIGQDQKKGKMQPSGR